MGKIPAGKRINHWAATIDLVPTFLEAARVAKPSCVKWDGLSFLSFLIPQEKSSYQHVKNWITGVSSVSSLHYSRIFLWHKVTEYINKGEPPNRSAAHYQQIKVIVKNEGMNGCVEAIYDHKYDHYEERNLVIINDQCMLNFDTYSKYSNPHELKVFINPEAGNKHCEEQRHKDKNSKKVCKEQYQLSISTKLSRMLESLRPFVTNGNHPFLTYTSKEHNKQCKVL